MKMIHQMIPNPRMLVQGYEPLKRKRVRPKKEKLRKKVNAIFRGFEES